MESGFPARARLTRVAYDTRHQVPDAFTDFVSYAANSLDRFARWVVEAHIAFIEMFRRLPSTLHATTDTPEWRENIVLRGLKSLPLEW